MKKRFWIMDERNIYSPLSLRAILWRSNLIIFMVVLDIERKPGNFSILAMIAKVWIKLYIEILGDPKMGRLPNHLWRRAVELFLLAGREGNDGAIPPVKEMVWILRLSQDKLLEDLHGLAKVGVVHEAEPGKWVVTNFVKRQEALTSTARSYYYRKRKEDATNRCKLGSENATVVVADSTSTSTSFSSSLSFSESLEEERVQGEEKPRPETRISPALLPANVPTGADPPVDVFRVYHENIGALTPMIAEALKDAEKSDGPEWICAAIAEAVKNNVRTWRYCETILERWRKEGIHSDNRVAEAGRRGRAGGGISDDQARDWLSAGQEGQQK